MRIAHGNRRSVEFATINFDRKVVSHPRLAHIYLKLEAILMARDQITLLGAGAGADGEFSVATTINQISGHTSGAIARYLSFGTISVDQAGMNVGGVLLRWKQKLHAIST